jgi:hypothetical protein
MPMEDMASRSHGGGGDWCRRDLGRSKAMQQEGRPTEKEVRRGGAVLVKGRAGPALLMAATDPRREETGGGLMGRSRSSRGESRSRRPSEQLAPGGVARGGCRGRTGGIGSLPHGSR